MKRFLKWYFGLCICLIMFSCKEANDKHIQEWEGKALLINICNTLAIPHEALLKISCGIKRL